MAVFEFLAASAGAWIVGAWHFLPDDGHVLLLLCAFAGVLHGGAPLCLFHLVKVDLLLVVALLVLYRRSFLYRSLLLLYGDLSAHEEGCDAIVHVVNH